MKQKRDQTADHVGLGEAQEVPIQRLLNEKQAAAYLGVSVAWLRQSRMKNPPAKSTTGPPFHKFGKLVRYSIEDLDGWLAEHRVDPRLPRNLISDVPGRAGSLVPTGNTAPATRPHV